MMEQQHQSHKTRRYIHRLSILTLTLVLGILLAQESLAIVGRPLTPVSFAGAARRSAVRVVRAPVLRTAAVVGTTAVVASSVSRNKAEAAAASQQSAAATQSAAAAAQDAAASANQAAAAAQQAAASKTPALKLPVGTTLPQLPDGCQSQTIGSSTYFSCSGNWLKPAMSGTKMVYQVVAQPTG